MTLPVENQEAPAFTLQNQDGTSISLADFKDKKNVVLYFYPKALTPGCITQACGIRDSKAEFKAVDTVVLGVSPDDLKLLNRFIEKKALNFDLLSDPDHAIADKYGAWGPKKFMGKSYVGILRSTFIINKSGILIKAMPTVKTKTHHDDVLGYIKENLI